MLSVFPDKVLGWINARELKALNLGTRGTTRSRPAGKLEADIVVELKGRCTEDGLLDFALTLPELPKKTPIDCRIQLLRCLEELSA